MWRALLSLITSRFILLVVACLAVNHQMSGPKTGGVWPGIRPTGVLLREVFGRISSRNPEVTTVNVLRGSSFASVFHYTHNPFLWLAHWTVKITHARTLPVLILFSNLFLLLFLSEIHALLSRIVTSEIAAATPILVVLWPTSYELSAGSSLAMSCWLLTLAIRSSMDNRWLVGGLALGGLALTEPLAAGLLPLMIYLFWFFQRDQPVALVARGTFFFLIPMAIAIYWSLPIYRNVPHLLYHSAAINLFTSWREGHLSWALSRSYLGQTITAIFFLAGAIIACVSHTLFMHRLIPVYLCGLLLLFSPLSLLPSRALLAGLCLEGIATVSTKPVLKVVQLVLLSLSIVEVGTIFGF
jgi:hypothetical protein